MEKQNLEARLTRKRATREEHGKTKTPEEMIGATAVAQRTRAAAHRARWQNAVLPEIPKEVLGPDWHGCWVSTTSKVDTVNHRLALGYVFMKPEEFPEGFQLGRLNSSDGKSNGLVMVNEMVAMKILNSIYQSDRREQYEEAVGYEQDIVDRTHLIANSAHTSYSAALEGGEIDGYDSMKVRKGARDVIYE